MESKIGKFQRQVTNKMSKAERGTNTNGVCKSLLDRWSKDNR